jgi:hypothetical protein
VLALLKRKELTSMKLDDSCPPSASCSRVMLVPIRHVMHDC